MKTAEKNVIDVKITSNIATEIRKLATAIRRIEKNQKIPKFRTQFIYL